MDPLAVLPLNSEFIAKRLPCGQLAAVLIAAWNDRRCGELRLQAEGGALILLGLEGGALRSLRSPTIEARAWTTAAEALPPPQLEFARNYAAPRNIECLKALERLVLLNASQILAIHTQTVTAEVLEFCCKKGHFTWTWSPSPESEESRLDRVVEPLALICQCLSATSDLGWSKAALSEYQQEALRLTGRVTTTSVEGLQDLTAAIERQPESIETLLLRNTIAEGPLVSMIYALLATGAVELPPPASRLHPPRSFTSVPSSKNTRLNDSKDDSWSSRAPTLPVPPRSIAKTPPSDLGGADTSGKSASSGSGVRRLEMARDQRSIPATSSFVPHKERNTEMSCLQAWLRTQVEPEYSSRALIYSQKAIAHFPKNAAIAYYLGGIHALRGELEEAELWLQRTLDLDPDHTEAERELRHIQIQRASNDD